MNENGIDLFLNVSVNFSEINIVKYEFKSDLLIIEVVLNREVNKEDEVCFINKTLDCINLLHNLICSQPKTLNIKFTRLTGLTFVRYYRDVKTLGEKEIGLFMGILRDEFNDCLVNDERPCFPRNSIKKQVKRDLLKKINDTLDSNPYLFAYRDHGKLCMF
ncbi:MAG: hypothetical protein ACOX6E_04250 [Syntrophomonadaceae bacterium]|jgi:hypothetical protein